MRTSIASLGLLAYVAVCLASVPQAAHADAFAMAGGMQSGSGPICYRWGTTPNGSIGAAKSPAASCSSQKYAMPLYWSNFFFSFTNRTVTVRGRRPTSASTLGCTLSVFSSNGVLISTASNSFAVTGAGYGNISLTVNNVLSTTSSFLTCTASGPETFLLKIDFTP